MIELPGDPVAGLDPYSGDLLDEAVEGLETSWLLGGTGDIAALAPPLGHPLRERVLIELVKVDQEYRWRSGQRRLLEAYLAEWPELGQKEDIVCELLRAECLTRATLDTLPTPEELESRFPEVSRGIDLNAIAAQAEQERAGSQAASDTSGTHTGQTLSAGPMSPPLVVGQLFGRDGRYRILGRLGQGGMGTVYRAYDTRLRREVALKIPRLDVADEPAALKRFVRESQAAARIRHPNICPIFDADEFEGTFYITMALVEGESLADWAKGRRVEPREAARLVRKVAQALAIVHSQGIVHRDIKPSNVMIDRSGEPLLMDFGLARLPQEQQPGEKGDRFSLEPGGFGDGETSLPGLPKEVAGEGSCTYTGTLLGTIPYMSPEQTYGRALEASSDVYSLGVVLYELLAGRPPFEGPPAEILASIRHVEPHYPRAGYASGSHLFESDGEKPCRSVPERCRVRRRFGRVARGSGRVGRVATPEGPAAMGGSRSGRFPPSRNRHLHQDPPGHHDGQSERPRRGNRSGS